MSYGGWTNQNFSMLQLGVWSLPILCGCLCVFVYSGSWSTSCFSGGTPWGTVLHWSYITVRELATSCCAHKLPAWACHFGAAPSWATVKIIEELSALVSYHGANYCVIKRVHFQLRFTENSICFSNNNIYFVWVFINSYKTINIWTAIC